MIVNALMSGYVIIGTGDEYNDDNMAIGGVYLGDYEGGVSMWWNYGLVRELDLPWRRELLKSKHVSRRQ